MNNKNICLKSAAASLLILTFIFNTVASADYKDYQNTLGRSTFLRTSNNKERYAHFSIENNVVNVEGRFTEEYPSDIYFSGVTLMGFKKNLKSLGDGSFKASISGTPIEDYAKIIIMFPSGKFLHYRIEYDNGWFFGDNGIEQINKEILESAREIPPEITAYYVSSQLDRTESAQALEEVNHIANEITAGLDNDYDKARTLSRWVSENIYYDNDSSEGIITPETIELNNVLKTKRTICAGFANLYAALLESAGIETLNIKGGVAGNNCKYEELPFKTAVHEWTAFWYEKEKRWVYADPGWDCANIYSNGVYQQRFMAMKYFDITPSALAQDHRAESAEARKYFDVLRYLDNAGENTGATTEQPTESIENNVEGEQETAALTPQTNSPPQTDTPYTNPPYVKQTADSTALYTVIFVLSALIVAMIIIVFKNRRD